MPAPGEPLVNPKKDEKRALDKEGIEQCGMWGEPWTAIEAQVDVIIFQPAETLPRRRPRWWVNK